MLSSAQGLFLLCAQKLLLVDLGDHMDARDQNWVSCLQGKSPTCCAIASAPNDSYILKLLNYSG